MSNRHVLRPTIWPRKTKEPQVQFELDKYEIGDMLNITWAVGYGLPPNGQYLVLDKGYFLWAFNAYLEVIHLQTKTKKKIYTNETNIDKIEIIGGVD